MYVSRRSALDDLSSQVAELERRRVATLQQAPLEMQEEWRAAKVRARGRGLVRPEREFTIPPPFTLAFTRQSKRVSPSLGVLPVATSLLCDGAPCRTSSRSTSLS